MAAPFLQGLETRIPFASAGAYVTNTQVDLIDMAPQIEMVSNLDFAPLHRTMPPTGLVVPSAQMVLESVFRADEPVGAFSEWTEPDVADRDGVSDMPVDPFGYVNGGHVRDRGLRYRAIGRAGKRQSTQVCGDNCGGRGKRKRWLMGDMSWRWFLKSVGRTTLRIRNIRKRAMGRRRSLESGSRKHLRMGSVDKWKLGGSVSTGQRDMCLS